MYISKLKVFLWLIANYLSCREFLFLNLLALTPLWKFTWCHVAYQNCTKKWSFPLRLSSVNMTKSAVSCRFGHIYWRNHNWKTSLFAQCKWYGSQKKNSKEVKKLYINWQSSNNWANLEFFRYNLEFFSIFSFFSFLLHLLLLFFFSFLPFLLLFFCYFWKCN